MNALDRKLIRDLIRLWPQAMAIALVMACGVATLILGVGSHASLEGSRDAYYERNRFAHVFATVTRAPNWLEAEIERIPGVAAVETRIKKIAIIDVPGLIEPASGIFVSLPDVTPQVLNTLYMRIGRTPTPGSDREIVVNEAFAEAHGFRLGDTFSAILNGKSRTLVIVGIALSPEFIYAIGPWDVVPDNRRLAVAWMSEEALAAAYDLEGAFSDVTVQLLRDGSQDLVIDELDALLSDYGSRGAYPRKDQISHAFVDAELQQLEVMSRVLPPIFLLVAAFLVNMTMNRLIALEREQIGLLKALGYGAVPIASHYLKFVAAIALIGTVIGAVAGTWLGTGLTRLFGNFYHFPFLIFDRDPSIYVIATLVAVASAVAGALKAVLSVAGLAPAVAMRPPAPPVYKRSLVERSGILDGLEQSRMMVVRNLLRWPVRAAMTSLGMAFAVAVLIASLWPLDSVDFMIDVTYFQSERQDASINFSEIQPYAALFEARRLPGVLTAEPYRSLDVRVTHGHLERRVGLMGKPVWADLSRVLDRSLEPIRVPETGVTLTEMLAQLLEAEIGDLVEVEVLDGASRIVEVPVTAIAQGYMGLSAFMNIDEVNRLNREAAVITGVHLSIDDGDREALLSRLKEIPSASFIALQKVSLEKFKETIAENIGISTAVYTGLAMIIAFGVVYNAARISLSERGRELASLRVLGFTRGEVSTILLAELAILTLLAQPVGWLLGYLFAAGMVQGFESELYRIPFVIAPKTFAFASLVVAGAAVISALLVRRRIDRLDMIEVLKTRE